MSIPTRSAPHRDEIAAGVVARTGIDAVMIQRLVEAFYARARRDPLIGPVFESRVADWDEHLAAMCRFWSSVVLMTGAYHGEPMKRHTPLPIHAAHFDRWLALFAETAREVCPPEAAALFEERAARIAQSLEMGIAVSRGRLLRRGERLIAS